METDWLGYIVTGGLGAGIVQTIRVIVDWRKGVKAHELDAKAEQRQERADTTIGFSELVDDLRAQLDAERTRLDTLQDRLDMTVRRRQIAYEYAAQLRQDIIDGRPPPPREWPEGI